MKSSPSWYVAYTGTSAFQKKKRKKKKPNPLQLALPLTMRLGAWLMVDQK